MPRGGELRLAGAGRVHRDLGSAWSGAARRGVAPGWWRGEGSAGRAARSSPRAWGCTGVAALPGLMWMLFPKDAENFLSQGRATSY